MNHCSHCGGSLHAKTLLYYDQLWGDETYRFEGVPAVICAAFGEVFFEAHVSQRWTVSWRAIRSRGGSSSFRSWICLCLSDRRGGIDLHKRGRERCERLMIRYTDHWARG